MMPDHSARQFTLAGFFRQMSFPKKKLSLIDPATSGTRVNQFCYFY
jgi:hypothetical protein